MDEKRVLLVDDLSFVRSAVRGILENDGYVVVGEASDGVEAIDKFNELKPDLVLLDITMPRMDGLEALKRIMRNYPDAKIVMCSALGQQRYIVKAIQLGARDFVVKPFKKERILSAVRKVV